MGDSFRQYHPDDSIFSDDLDFNDRHGLRCECRDFNDFPLFFVTDHQKYHTGMRQVDRNTLDVGKGMGMTSWQRLYMIELPLSVSVIMAGIRNALVVAIGITAIGAFVGAGLGTSSSVEPMRRMVHRSSYGAYQLPDGDHYGSWVELY